MRKDWFQLGALLAVFVVVGVIFGQRTLQAVPIALPVPAAASPAANAPGPQQYPIVDKIADRIVQKYQGSTCQQLDQERAQKQAAQRPPEEQRAITILQNNPQVRQEFINRIAAPIANKMFECGMIP